MAATSRICRNLTRQRKLGSDVADESKFVRCLSTLDLTSIGIGTVVGAGLYVVTGQLARDVAGPAVVLSFAIAALSALLSGICYAEFGCRIPKAGSAYVYTYVSLGEIWGFIVGWNMILEYIIAAASLARACSEYINALAGGRIFRFFIRDIANWHHPGLARFPDFLAVLIALVVMIVVSSGTEKASIFNKALTFLNLSVVCFVICVGIYYTDADNWSGVENFAPYGASGVFAAAGSCFFAFVGFDVIGTAGEETVNPKKAIPTALMATIFVSFLAYFGVSTVLTLMVPYNELNAFAPLAEAFSQRGFAAAKYIISIGAVFATTGSLLTVSFAAPRVVCSMADDGLLFRFLSKINSTTHVPVRAVLACSVVIALLALLLELKQLVEMLSIGTLIAYTMVAIAVLLTRFQCGIESVELGENEQTQSKDEKSNSPSSWFKRIFGKGKEDQSEAEYTRLQTTDEVDKDITQEKLDKEIELDTKDCVSASHREPTDESSFHASLAAFVLTVAVITVCVMLTAGYVALAALQVWAILCVCVSCIVIVAAFAFLHRLPRNQATFPFTVPMVPLVPVLTIFANMILLVNLSTWTYLRFAVWMVIGMAIYIFYGYKHSSEAQDPNGEPANPEH